MSDKCKDKKCPSNKICNPASGRCVLKEGAIGKKLLRKSPKRKSPKHKSPKRKSPKRKSRKKVTKKSINCKYGKLKRPVKDKVTGKIRYCKKAPRGKKKAKSPKRKSPKRESPKRESPKVKSPKAKDPFPKKYSCQFDADGICENILSSLPASKKCSYNKKEKRCIYSKSYNKKRKKDYILVLKTKKDHNNAFGKKDDGLFSLLKSLKSFNYIYKEILTKKDFEEALKKIPEECKIVKLIIMAHGTKNNFSLGEYRINKSTIYDFAEMLKRKLSKNASILLHSCLTGKGGVNADNIANLLSLLLPGIPVYGAENEIATNTLFIIKSDNDFNRRKLEFQYMIEDPKKANKMYRFYHPRK